MKESDILRTILDGLAAKKIWRKRMNSGAMFGSHKGKRWAVKFGEPGMADILAWFQRSIIWIECKNEKGKQTPDQSAFEREVKQEGHYYIVARSWDDVKRYLGL